MSWQAHHEAAQAAIASIREIGEVTVSMAEKQQSALGVIAMAVGEDPSTESGRNAMEFTQVLGERISELARICDNTISELERYVGGF